MEIKAFGDTVRISLPDANAVEVAMSDGTTEVCPVAQGTGAFQKVLKIDKIATFSFKFSDVEQVQSQFNLLDGYSAVAMQKLGDKKDKQVMLALIKAATDGVKIGESGYESGTAVGVRTVKANIIGTAAAPQLVTKDNIYDTIVDARVALTQAGALNGDGFYSFKGNNEEAELLAPVLTVDPVIYGLMLKSTQLTHPTAAADNVIRSAQQPMMAGFEIDIDTVLGTITSTDVDTLKEGAHIAIGATKMAVTYANQYTRVEKLRDPDCFADIVRGLELYGFLVVHPECAVVLFLTEDAGE